MLASRKPHESSLRIASGKDTEAEPTTRRDLQRSHRTWRRRDSGGVRPRTCSARRSPPGSRCRTAAVPDAAPRARRGSCPGEIGYPGERLPPGIVASEAARGEVLLCQAQPRSDLRIETRALAAAGASRHGVVVERTEPLALGGTHASLRILGPATPGLRPGNSSRSKRRRANASVCRWWRPRLQPWTSRFTNWRPDRSSACADRSTRRARTS